jgi:hypothetical protein
LHALEGGDEAAQLSGSNRLSVWAMNVHASANTRGWPANAPGDFGGSGRIPPADRSDVAEALSTM